MIQPKVYVSFFLDASRPNAEGKCLVKLNVYQKPDKKRYATEFHLTKEEWEKLNSQKLRDDYLKEIKKKMNSLQSNAEKVIGAINPFSFVAFEENFFQTGKKVTSSPASRMLSEWFTFTVKKLTANDQISTASSYKITYNTLNAYKANLQLQDITTGFLEGLEKHLTAQGKSAATIGIYLRNLRAIINFAIKEKALHRDNYPFVNYQIPTGKNVKKALKDSDISRLMEYNPQNKYERKALDFWKLSYLCNGMNFADILQLRKENISGNHLSFIREKTKRTKKKDVRPIKVGLNPLAKEIIETYKCTNELSPFLFPFLELGLTAVTIKGRCKRVIRFVNKHMQKIGADLGITSNLNTYAARHTFATVMMRNGVSTSFIKSSLGHSSEIVTENYLGSFEDDTALEYANLLTDFSSKKLKAV